MTYYPIIRSGFLHFCNCHKQLLDGSTNLFSNGDIRNSLLYSLNTISNNLSYGQIVEYFPNITESVGTPRQIKLTTMDHILKYQAPQAQIVRADNQAKVELGAMLNTEITWHPCGDYEALNARTIRYRYRVKNIKHFSFNRSGCKISCTTRIHNKNRLPNNPKTAVLDHDLV